MDSMAAAGLTPDQARGQLDALVQSQSVMLATSHVFLLCAIVFTLVAGVVWFAPRPKAMMGGGGGH
jgi:DHA2 family multidrug resistance protein